MNQPKHHLPKNTRASTSAKQSDGWNSRIEQVLFERFEQLEHLLTDITDRQNQLDQKQETLDHKQEQIASQNNQLTQEFEQAKQTQAIIKDQNQQIKSQEQTLQSIQGQLAQKQDQLQDDIEKLAREQSLSDAKKQSFANHIKNQRKEIHLLNEQIQADSEKLKAEQEKLQAISETVHEKQHKTQAQNAQFHEVFHTLTLHQRQIISQQELIENQQHQINQAKEILKKETPLLSNRAKAEEALALPQPLADAHLPEKYRQLQAQFSSLQEEHNQHLLKASQSNFDEHQHQQITSLTEKLDAAQGQILSLSKIHKTDLQSILALEQDLAHQHTQIKMLEVTPLEHHFPDLVGQKQKLKQRKKRLRRAKRLLDKKIIQTRKQRLAQATDITFAEPATTQDPFAKSQSNTHHPSVTFIAISLLTRIAATLGIIVLLSVYVVQSAVPDQWQSDITLRLAPRESPLAAGADWLESQARLLYSQKLLDETRRYLAAKDRTAFSDDGQLRDFYQAHLAITSPSPGALKLRLTHDQPRRSAQMLKAIAKSRIAYQNAQLENLTQKSAIQAQLSAIQPQAIPTGKAAYIFYLVAALIAGLVLIYFPLKYFIQRKTPPSLA